MSKQFDKILAENLVKNGALSSEDIQRALMEAQSYGESLQSYLVRSGLAQQTEVLKALGQGLNLEFVNLKNISIDKATIEKIPVRVAWYYKFIPLKIEGKTLSLAVSSPLDVKVQDEIRVHLGFEPKIFLATENDILEVFKKHYGLAAETIERIMTRQPQKNVIDMTQDKQVEDIEKTSEDASVIKLVNQIILEAFKKRSTDIHIEPYRNKVRIRYRIDGVLVDANLPPEIKHFLNQVISRIKIMANLSIEERRLPQDGSAVVKTKDQTLDLRVSTIPTPNGESLVIRILPTKVMFFSLEKLGIGAENIKIFRELICKPHGIILVTGPTGSGKTTTLYACLNEISSQELKIITIEDPVEYEMEGITQIQVNSKVNLDFARGLRSILRHDPDIIMVGEVSVFETAEIAIRTALTGHLVFSTLHTNDASSGVTRLVDMGVEPYLVASSVEAFVAQRLVRIICPQCKIESPHAEVEIKKEIASVLKISDFNQIKIYRGRGCEHCSNTGFYGRTAIYEILVMNETIRAAILEKPRADHIKQIAVKYGMTTLRQNGLKKVLEGVTTPEEVLNITANEDFLYTGTPISLSKGRKESPALEQSYRILPREVFSAKNEYDSRVYTRISERLKIKYQVFSEGEKTSDAIMIKPDLLEHSTITKDLSAGGLLFMATHPISIGTILELNIQLENKGGFISCLARACRIEEDELTNSFGVAAYFLDIASADRAKISDLVKNKVEAKEPTLKKT